jgi:predicted phage tail protein
MNFSYSDLKKLLYVLQTAAGIGLIVIAHFFWIASSAEANIFDQAAALVLFFMGLSCILFGVMAYHFRQDPDIWR